MTDNNSKQPLVEKTKLVPPSTGGPETIEDDLMDGDGEHSLCVNRNVSKNQKINTKV